MRKHRNVPIVLAGLLLMSPRLAVGQATNGATMVTQEMVAAGGGKVGGGNPMSAITVVGVPIGGSSVNGVFALVGGSPATTQLPAGTRTIAVEGTVNDATASVVVNGIQAAITGTTFRAAGIQLIEGPTTITATATDPAGNTTTATITVILDTHPPARPTVATTPAVTTATSYTLSGTKTKGTSLWINGVESVPRNDFTDWTVTVSLQEGDNVLVIVAKDATGNQSTSSTVTIVVDNLPPVITVTAPSKTNVTPLALSGTVDDSLTSVTVNGTPASRSGLTFQASVPLLIGSNTFVMTATSPNGHVSTRTVTVIRGTIPTITSLQPADGTKLYMGASTTVQAIATDAEQDPIEFQILRDAQVIVDWSAGASTVWIPTEAQRGGRVLEIRARDGFGGSASKSAEVYVLRQPVSPP